MRDSEDNDALLSFLDNLGLRNNVHRFLQSDDPTADIGSDSSVLRTTFTVYGSVLLLCFLLFCYVRQRYPRAYTIRDWAEDIKSPLAKHQYGYFSWMWNMNSYTEDELLEYCGMDAICFLRILSMGYRICGIGALNAIFLMPIYSTASDIAIDRIVKVTVSNVEVGSSRFIATVVAAYILFGYVMFLILEEFTWFTEFRHKYLRKAKARNFSIFVRNIPVEYCSNAGLEYFFKHCFGPEHVVETRIRVKAPSLQTQVANRDKLLTKFAHALAYEELTNREYMVKKSVLSGTRERVLETTSRELKASNEDICNRINAIEAKTNVTGASPIIFDVTSVAGNCVGDISVFDDSVAADQHQNSTEASVQLDKATGTVPNQDITVDASSGSGLKLISNALKGISETTKGVASGALDVAASSLNLLNNNEDGEFYDAGFVSFSNLCTTNAALQMVHHSTPFDVEVMAAPDPEDILWNNIGRSHKDVQVGALFSLAGTTALCIFWTVPMSFISTISQISGLRSFGFINDLLDAEPWLEPVLEQLAPLLLIFVNGLLPTILRVFAMREGPVSLSVVEASLFSKLAAFAIIQTFFVSFIGGNLSALASQYKTFSESPLLIIDFLAENLPAKSTFFLQLVFVSNAISLSLELLRVVPLIIAYIRGLLSPKLTEEERNTPVFGLSPLCDPGDFGTADNLSGIVLIYMVMLVYAVIAPLSAFILGFCFTYMRVCYKHQFLYIYPNRPDSGGKIWTDFIRVIMTCMVIAEVTILGLMGLKKSTAGAVLMFPLIGITILFNGYIRQQHFRAAAFLPSRDCFKQDLRNGTGFDLTFLSGAYQQVELQTKVKVPKLTPSQIVFLKQSGIETDLGHTATDIEGLSTGVPKSVARAMNKIGESSF